MTSLDQQFHDLVTANRILAREEVVDAFGHVSIRHPEHPGRYILSQSRAPELVNTPDLMEYTLEGKPLDQQDRPMYSERPIHGGVYEARPDVMAVVPQPLARSAALWRHRRASAPHDPHGCRRW